MFSSFLYYKDKKSDQENSGNELSGEAETNGRSE